MVFPEVGKYRLIALAHAGLLFLMAASFAAVDSWAQSAAAAIHPVLRLEKPKYLLGESIRFWVGVEVEPPGVIPRALRAACSLEITRPDGSTETQSIGWPVDGNPDRGWSGGPRSACACFFLRVIGLPHECTRSASPLLPTNTTFRGESFRGCRYSFMFRPPILLASPVVPTAAHTAAGRPRL